MEVFNNFFSLLSDVWKDGISGASFTDVITALAVFFIFLLLRSVVSRFIVKRIETYVWKLYRTEWTSKIPPGEYQIMVGTDYDKDPTRNLNIEIDIQ